MTTAGAFTRGVAASSGQNGAGTGPSSPNPARFFVYVLVLSVPFYVWGVFWPMHWFPLGLPVSALMVFVPAAVATMLIWRESGSDSAWAVWRRVGDTGRITNSQWSAFSIFCMPLVFLIAYAARLAFGLTIPSAASVALPWAPGIFAIYFFGAVFEEIGWTGYATERLQQRESILRAGVTIGSVWAAWHIVPWWVGQQHTVYWVVGQSIATILMRVIMSWIYANGGKSLFLAVVFHAMINTSFSLFPNGGAHYDPLSIAAVLAVLIGVLNRSLFRRSAPAGGTSLIK